MNDLILNRLKEIELNKLDYKAKNEKNYNFSKISLFIIFFRNKHTKFLSIEDADIEQSKLCKELSDINKGGKPIEKKSFLKNVGFALDVREKSS